MNFLWFPLVLCPCRVSGEIWFRLCVLFVLRVCSVRQPGQFSCPVRSSGGRPPISVLGSLSDFIARGFHCSPAQIRGGIPVFVRCVNSHLFSTRACVRQVRSSVPAVMRQWTHFVPTSLYAEFFISCYSLLVCVDFCFPLSILASTILFPGARSLSFCNWLGSQWHLTELCLMEGAFQLKKISWRYVLSMMTQVPTLLFVFFLFLYIPCLLFY
jgi:hypothetical protein